MNLMVYALDGRVIGEIAISESIFCLEPRRDLLQRVVSWQLACRQRGTHQSQSRADVSCTGSKMYKQKGTGRARHSSSSVPQFRGGGKAHGPVSRSHAYTIPKKVRALALRHALSVKMQMKKLMILDAFTLSEPKTRLLVNFFIGLRLKNALMIGAREIDLNFRRAVSNIPTIDTLPVQGVNVYDILRRDNLVISRGALELLEERLK
ncbi:MAG: large subunit ribosomal protein L4 [Candidatus Tokpelaia sp. JSC161]|jgi:large subunit ribosomal protein L4|nr:MAG: large subunit ribosomal protein L4 [Candidatus Tokpelaia sp. JSC161]